MKIMAFGFTLFMWSLFAHWLGIVNEIIWGCGMIIGIICMIFPIFFVIPKSEQVGIFLLIFGLFSGLGWFVAVLLSNEEWALSVKWAVSTIESTILLILFVGCMFLLFAPRSTKKGVGK